MKKINFITLMVVILVINTFGNCFAASLSKEAVTHNLNEIFQVNKLDEIDNDTKKVLLRIAVCCQDALERGWSDRIHNREFDQRQTIIAGMEFLNNEDAFKGISSFYQLGYYMNVDNPEEAYTYIHQRLTEIAQVFNQQLNK